MTIKVNKSLKEKENELRNDLEYLEGEWYKWDEQITQCIRSIRKCVNEQDRIAIKNILKRKTVNTLDIKAIKPDEWRWMLESKNSFAPTSFREKFCCKLIWINFNMFIYGSNDENQYNTAINPESNLDLFYKGFMKLRPFLIGRKCKYKNKKSVFGIPIFIHNYNDSILGDTTLIVYNRESKRATLYIGNDVKIFKTFKALIAYIKMIRKK